MKFYDIVLSTIGWFCVGCAIGALLLGHFSQAWDFLIVAMIFLYFGRRFWWDPPPDP